MSTSWKPPRRAPDTAFNDSEEARTLLQVRVSSFARLAFAIGATFFPLAIVARGALGMAGRPGLLAALTPAALFQLLGIVMFLVAWLYARGPRRSSTSLRVTDALVTVGGSYAMELTSLGVPPWVRPDQFLPLAVSVILTLRSAVVPSTARLSVGLAGVALAPIPVLVFMAYDGKPLFGGTTSAAGFTLNAAILCALVGAVSAVVSRTVHGLRERVREAAQLGQYTLSEKIGEGGMGVVFKASHAMLRRPTAIKLLPPEKAGEHNLARFEREVQLTSRLTHPNTISVYDFGRTPEGIFYYAMEYLDGVDLQTLVDEDGVQEPGRVVHVLAQAAGALAEAHGIGLIHRDVKPANVMLCERGGAADVVKMLDFGLVKELSGAAHESASQSLVNEIIGTPLYLSPEAIVSPPRVDGRSDLYALGAVGYLLLTGGPPFSGDSVVEVCGHHLHTPVVPPSERAGRAVPRELERLIVACLSKVPDDRPRDAAALREALLSCREVPAWTSEQAATWWRERGPVLRNRRPAPAKTPETHALRVTLEARG